VDVAVLGDGEVRQAADAQEERQGLVAVVERADHGEGAEVDALGAQAGGAHGRDDLLDHRAARRDEDDAQARALRRVDDAELLEVDDRLVEAHGQLALGLEADDRVELLGVLDGGDLERPDDDALVGDADADAAVEPVLAEHVPQRGRERLRVGDLAVADDVGRERRRRGRGDAEAAVDRDGSGRHGARLHVEAHDGLVLA
jgi:hypothetical protein